MSCGRASAPPQRPAGRRASEPPQDPRLGPRPRSDGEPSRRPQPSPPGRRTAGAWPPVGRAPSSGGRGAAGPAGRVDAAPGGLRAGRPRGAWPCARAALGGTARVPEECRRSGWAPAEVGRGRTSLREVTPPQPRSPTSTLLRPAPPPRCLAGRFHGAPCGPALPYGGHRRGLVRGGDERTRWPAHGWGRRGWRPRGYCRSPQQCRGQGGARDEGMVPSGQRSRILEGV